MTARPLPHGACVGLTRWTPADDRALCTSFAAGGIAAALQALPGRSEAAIYHRAKRLKVTRRRRWNPAEDARLRRLWDAELDLEDIAQRHDRTVTAIYVRAKELGLPLGCPAGWEYLSAAATRCGYDVTQFRRVLTAQGVTIRRSLTMTLPAQGSARRGRRRIRHIVAVQEVDEAVAGWLEAEPVGVAARRLGICGQSLARRLRAVGVERPVAARAHWRVRPEDVARAAEVTLRPGPRMGPKNRKDAVPA